MITQIREKYGIIGEVSITTFVALLVTFFGIVGGAYGFSWYNYKDLNVRIDQHISAQNTVDVKNATQFSELNSKLDLLLKYQGIKTR